MEKSEGVQGSLSAQDRVKNHYETQRQNAQMSFDPAQIPQEEIDFLKKSYRQNNFFLKFASVGMSCGVLYTLVKTKTISNAHYNARMFGATFGGFFAGHVIALRHARQECLREYPNGFLAEMTKSKGQFSQIPQFPQANRTDGLNVDHDDQPMAAKPLYPTQAPPRQEGLDDRFRPSMAGLEKTPKYDIDDPSPGRKLQSYDDLRRQNTLNAPSSARPQPVPTSIPAPKPRAVRRNQYGDEIDE